MYGPALAITHQDLGLSLEEQLGAENGSGTRQCKTGTGSGSTGATGVGTHVSFDKLMGLT
jgi:hypothetical protein